MARRKWGWQSICQGCVAWYKKIEANSVQPFRHFNWEMRMLNSRRIIRIATSVACGVALAFSLTSIAQDVAQDMASFATGGYARGLRSMELMHKMDTNGDGMITKQEWIAFQEKVFAMLDKKKAGNLDAKEFIDPSGRDLATFATGGFARGLRTQRMMHKIDTDGDGMVSHDEFIAYQTKVFDMMDKSTVHKGMLGKEEIMFATGGASRQ
jgi:hypothetical protein